MEARIAIPPRRRGTVRRPTIPDFQAGWMRRAYASHPWGLGAIQVRPPPTGPKPPATPAPKPPETTTSSATAAAGREPTNGRQEGAWIALLVILAAAHRARRH